MGLRSAAPVLTRITEAVCKPQNVYGKGFMVYGLCVGAQAQIC